MDPTYGASKAAAWSYSHSARMELKAQRTHVVGVYVGFVDTDLTTRTVSAGGVTYAYRELGPSGGVPVA